jgi:hypothetical protein
MSHDILDPVNSLLEWANGIIPEHGRELLHILSVPSFKQKVLEFLHFTNMRNKINCSLLRIVENFIDRCGYALLS